MSYSLLSQCCCAPPCTNGTSELDGLEWGICSKCKEHASFYDEDEEDDDE